MDGDFTEDIPKVRSWEEFMTGIPSELFKQIRKALLDCGPFGSNQSMVAVFAAPELRPWRHGVPQASAQAARVSVLIAYLIEKHRADTGSNALILLLHVLSDQIDPGAECHERLKQLADELERTLDPNISDETALHDRLDKENRDEIEGLVREDRLQEALDALMALQVPFFQADYSLLAERLSRLRTQERRGVITHLEADAKRTQIAQSILDLIKSGD